MPPARVVAVAPGSPAESTGIQPGDEVLALKGEAVRDVIRYQLQADEPVVELEVRRGGLEQLTVVEKPAGAPLGLELDTPVFDRVQTCDNHCPFCFIHQLPKGMRRSLYLKDDDYRLSFLYGNFTTLTRFTEADLERVVSAADEYYVLGAQPFPGTTEYEGYPQHENGVGMVRAFEADVRAAVAGEPAAGLGPRAG